MSALIASIQVSDLVGVQFTAVLVTVIAPLGHPLAQAPQLIQYSFLTDMCSNLSPGSLDTGNANASHGQISTQAPQV